MSIPLIQDNQKDSINASLIAIKREEERLQALIAEADKKIAQLNELKVNKSDIVDEVTLNNMQSVTSNAVARTIFPDYSENLNTISSSNRNGFTAPCDCYIVWGMIVTSERHLTINDNTVGWYDNDTNRGVCGFSGYVKQGDVIKDSNTASGYAVIKNFLKAYRIH